jgi:hypothetical protein
VNLNHRADAVLVCIEEQRSSMAPMNCGTPARYAGRCDYAAEALSHLLSNSAGER